MKRCRVCLFLLLIVGSKISAQEKIWSFSDCFEYAINENIDIQQSKLSVKENELNFQQYKNDRLPSLSASVDHTLSWEKAYNTSSGSYGNYNQYKTGTYSVGGSLSLYSGHKVKNEIKQSALDLETVNYDTKAVAESVELSVLEGYLNILYAYESVNNAKEQIALTEEDLKVTKEKLDVGVLSKSDYLQIKAELASEKLTLSDENSTLTMAKVSLMQLMEYPIDMGFEVARPSIDSLLNTITSLDAAQIFEDAKKIKPQVKAAELSVSSTAVGEDLAKADYYPSIDLSASAGSNWYGERRGSYSNQLANGITPAVGLSISIPIFQKKQVKTNVSLAKIATNSAKLDEIATLNTLRKDIEQTVANIVTAQDRFSATQEQYDAANESYKVAEEKFKLGVINSVDFITVKNDLITAESDLLQAKYTLVYNTKVLDFYKGITISL